MKKTLNFISGHWSIKDNDSEPMSSSRSQSAYLKRREQVRKAQRTHRERKAHYLNTLESEVLRLRTNEANFLKKINELEAQIYHLHETITRNGIGLAAVEKWTQSGAELDTNAAIETPILVSTNAENIVQNITAPHLRLENADSRNNIARTSPSHNPVIAQPAEAESTMEGSLLAHGMEFVLTLERPCLGHIDVDLNKSSEPSGHVLTASMPLLNACHYPHPFTDESPSSDVLTTIFDRLTILSSQLVDDEEFSPIQLWNHIKDQPLAYKLNISKLRVLAENLLPHVNCYGFGAVMEKDISVNMVAQMLTSN